MKSLTKKAPWMVGMTRKQKKEVHRRASEGLDGLLEDLARTAKEIVVPGLSAEDLEREFEPPSKPDRRRR